MNRIVTKLAMNQIRVYKKKTALEITVIALISAMVFLVNILIPPFRQLYRSWCTENYGTWYAYTDIPDDIHDLCRYELDQNVVAEGKKDLISEEFRTETAKEEDLLHFGWLYIQGSWNEMTVAHADQNLYALCNLKLTEGTYPEKDEIAVSEQLSSEFHKSIGDSITLNLTGSEKEYTVCGILHKPQEIFPDLYTGEAGGHALYFFDRMFGFNDADNHTILLSSYGLQLPYTENRYGFDHYTKTNDEFRWRKETSSFNDFTLAQTAAVFSAAVFLFLVQSAGGKKRAREYTVLRAAGMTSGQLVSMALLETAAVSAAGIPAGFLLSMILGCAYAALCSAMMKTDTAILISAFFTQLMKITGLCFLILLFCLAGALIPVLRASSNALSGSFEEVYQGKKKKHRKKLKYRTSQRLAVRRLESRKGLLVTMSFLAALLSLLANPAEKGDGLETSGSFRGSIPVVFESSHFIEIHENTPLDPSLYEGLPVSSELFTIAQGPQKVPYISAPQKNAEYILCLFGNLIALDETVLSLINYTGNLPANDHEIMLFPGHCEIIEEKDGAELSAGLNASIGDTVYFNEEPYTICGLVLPNETKTAVIPSSAGNIETQYDLYEIPEGAAVLPMETINHLDLQSRTCERLRFDQADDLYPILNRMVQNGFNIGNSIGVSDLTVIYDSYEEKFLSIHLSYGITAFLLSAAVITAAVLAGLEERADRRELISLRCAGITRRQMIAVRLYQSVMMGFFSAGFIALYMLLRMVSGVPMNLSFPIMALEIFITILIFSFIFAIPVLAQDISFEKILEA